MGNLPGCTRPRDDIVADPGGSDGDGASSQGCLVVDTEPPPEPLLEEPPERENLFKQTDFVLNPLLLKALKKRFRRRRRLHVGIESDEEEDESPGEVDDSLERILSLFDRFEKWDFPIFELSRLLDGYPLLYVSYVFLHLHDLFRKFSIDESTFVDYMIQIQSLYNNDNQFYNCTRSASILHTFHVSTKKGLGDLLTDEHYLCSFFVSNVMYLDHPGLDNYYQCVAETYVSTIYNDLSSLQNSSCLRWVKMLFQSEAAPRILGGFSKSVRRSIREIVLDMVLATDYEEGNVKGLLESFKLKIENGTDFSTKEDARILLQMVSLFCSLDYCFKTKSIYLKWVKQHLIQGYGQARLLQSKELPIREIFDASLDRVVTRPQAELLETSKTVVKALMEIFPKLKTALARARRNRRYWHDTYNPETSPEFADILEYHQNPTQLLKQQARLVGFLRSIPIPTQDVNVPLSEQEALMPRPNADDTHVWETSLRRLVKRFRASNKMTRRPFESVPLLYAVCDIDGPSAKPFEAQDRIESVMRMFDRIDEWNFDMFALKKMLNDDPLVMVSHVLFVKYDWINRFGIDERVLMGFLSEVCKGYQRNPYHNALHATDVMQIVNAICVKGGVVERMTHVDLLAAVVSSLVHDLDHPGLNDAFQVHSFSYLAKLYNDRSVLEAHHCSETFRLMREENMNLFANMSVADRLDCRKTMVEMIISTDMCNHAKYVKAFNRLIEEESDFTSKEDLRVALQIAIKMADVSNPSRPTYIYLQWTENIICEFFRQGDKEKELDLPVSPLMDREKSVVSKGQNAFMEYVLIPMFKSFSSVFPKMSFSLDNIRRNKEYWKSHDTFEPEWFVPKSAEMVPIERFVDQDYDPICEPRPGSPGEVSGEEEEEGESG